MIHNPQFITDTEVLTENSQKGWICPKCGAVVSPHEKTCPNCRKNEERSWQVGDNPNQNVTCENIIFD